LARLNTYGEAKHILKFNLRIELAPGLTYFESHPAKIVLAGFPHISQLSYLPALISPY
jgi:hypothetical protein